MPANKQNVRVANLSRDLMVVQAVLCIEMYTTHLLRISGAINADFPLVLGPRYNQLSSLRNQRYNCELLGFINVVMQQSS